MLSSASCNARVKFALLCCRRALRQTQLRLAGDIVLALDFQAATIHRKAHGPGCCLRQQHGKFIAADVRDDVLRAECCAQHSGRTAQQLIAGRVSFLPVVRRLQCVHIGHDDADWE